MVNHNLNEEGEQASFNEALYGVSRLDILLKRIQDSKLAPFSPNSEYGIPNYRARIISLESLWQEVRFLCSVEEVTLIDRYWKIVDPLSNIERKINNEYKINTTAYSKLDGFLRLLESEIRRLLFAKGLTSPVKDKSVGL